MSVAIKDFQIKESYFKLVEKALFSYLWEGIYKPMFDILNIQPMKAKNAGDSVIIGALREGTIYYADGVFYAKKRFSNAQSSKLKQWGAIYDKRSRGWRLPLEKVPNEIRVFLAESQIDTARRMQELQKFLDEVQANMPYIVESMIFDTEVKTILDDAGNEISKNAKRLNIITPELTEGQLQELADTYTNNMRDYVIKDWDTKRIPEMRRKVQEAVLNGYRRDKVQEMLEKEYGIAARKAKFLARNETGIFLAQFQRVTYQAMGFQKFIWRTITDGKERELHRKLNGKVFRYDDPPIIDERTGQRGLPGEIYNCRCTAIPTM